MSQFLAIDNELVNGTYFEGSLSEPGAGLADFLGEGGFPPLCRGV
jgi:hypothetical protein